MQNPKLKWILTILTVLVMIIIFLLSCRVGTESREDSGFFSLRLVNKVTKDYEGLSADQQYLAESNLNKLIRKIVHVCEFAGLAFLIRLTLESWFGPSIKTPKSKKLTIQTLLGGFLYACSDEIHQIFVPDRYARPLDVLIDSSGVIIGTVFALLVLCIITKNTTPLYNAQQGSNL